MTPTNKHHCHAHGCEVPIPPAMFMCAPHWFKLPRQLRVAVWSAYVPGQEVRKDPTPEYLAAAEDALGWMLREESHLLIIRPTHTARLIAGIPAEDVEA